MIPQPLFIATQFVAILWPFLLLFHIEKVAVVPGYTKTNAFEFLYYPYAHNPIVGVVLGILKAAFTWLSNGKHAVPLLPVFVF